MTLIIELGLSLPIQTKWWEVVQAADVLNWVNSDPGAL